MRWLKFGKDEKGFTGLEAAIVLIAFVTVAAVFSYVMLGAGFFTTQKSKQVVHTGVAEASSSLELDGQYIYLTANQTGSNGDVKMIDFYITLTAGKTKVDMNKVTFAYKDKDDYAQIPFIKFIVVDDGLTGTCSDVLSNYSNYYAVISFDTNNDPQITFYNKNDRTLNCSLSKVSYDLVNDTGGTWKVTPSGSGYLPFWYYKPIVADDPKNMVKSNEKFQVFADLLVMATSMDTADKFHFDTTKDYYLVKLESSKYYILSVTQLNATTNYADGQIRTLPGTSEELTVELKSPIGAPLIINKETPPSLKNVSYV